jgi:type IV secretory pathway VirB3-like protein
MAGVNNMNIPSLYVVGLLHLLSSIFFCDKFNMADILINFIEEERRSVTRRLWSRSIQINNIYNSYSLVFTKHN